MEAPALAGFVLGFDLAMSSPPAGQAGGTLSHLDARGAARMVDVSERPSSVRQAVAEGYLTLAPATLALVGWWPSRGISRSSMPLAEKSEMAASTTICSVCALRVC